ncbi:hypothetical protein [Clostridium peptidivorans]|uniref:hypothetical protein n=1 Tax=Clostridium peptidivorans TaxID=100174 RepID=UPI001177BCC2|nr:hypothetical protein [Clostridium peptidivorans]
MKFAFRKASLRKKALIFLPFKAPKPSKLAIAQTVEGSIRHLKIRNKELLVACSMLSTMQIPYLCSTLKISLILTD